MKKMIQVQLPVILRIFEENQNPVGGDSRTNDNQFKKEENR
jgi:hypothetical protein